MADRNTALKQPKPRFRVGDWVTYVVGGSRHTCEVIQYVGPIGLNAVHFYRLREPIWYGDPQEFDFPETSLEPASTADMKELYPPDQQPHDPYAVPLPDYE